MPALVAFNRRWTIGSDDFALSGIIPLLVRIVWFMAVAIIFNVHIHSHNHFGHCPAKIMTIVYFSLFFSILILTIILEILIIYVSSRGTIVNVQPRKNLPHLLYIRVILFAFEIIWSFVGILIIANNWKSSELDCDNSIMTLILVVVILNWIGLIVNLVTVFIKFDPLGHVREKERRKLVKRRRRISSVRSVFNVETPKALWERRCWAMCCGVKSDVNASNAFADVSSIFEQVFEDHDVVASDILAGLTLLQKQHKLLKIQGLLPKASQTLFPELQKPSKLATDVLPRAVHFLRYAISSYGFLFYLFDNLACGLCKLCRHKACVCCCLGDEYCDGYNTAVVKEINGLKNAHIVYITYQNKIYEIPFFVAVDHNAKSVVISLRGTLSVEDALTDANADSASMVVGSQKMYAHKGILIVSRNVKQILDNQKIIEKAFARAKSDDYELVVTGHSLGGGAAAILAILLKPQWPDVKCFSFASPGGLVSLDAVEYSSSFVTTVILGSDLISRMSLESLDDIKNQLIKVVMETDKSKCILLSNACISSICGVDDRTIEGYEQMVITENENQNYIARCQQRLTCDATTNADTLQEDEVALTADEEDQDEEDEKRKSLYLPGQILWIKKLSEGMERSTCCGKRKFVATWAKHEEFASILVKPSMVTDHVPFNLMNAMNDIINDISESYQHV